MVVFKLVLFVCCGLRFSRLMQQPSIENNTIFATASEVNELPATGKSVLRGGKSMGAQDCDKMLGKKGWDFVIGCDSSQCAVVYNIDLDAEKCPSNRILNKSLRNVWNAVIQSNCIGNSFCTLLVDPFIVGHSRFPEYDMATRPGKALGACLVNSGSKSTTRVQWWRRNIDTIGDKYQKLGDLSRISCCYVCDNMDTSGHVASHDVEPLSNPATDIGDLWFNPVYGSQAPPDCPALFTLDFPGKPGMWYNVIHDDNITYNWFLSECSKSGTQHGEEEHSILKTSCVSGIGLTIGDHKIEVSIVNPNRTTSGSCDEINAPRNCLSGGNLRVYIDGKHHKTPGNFQLSSKVRFSAANLPWGCKRTENVMKKKRWNRQQQQYQTHESKRRWNTRELRWSLFRESDSFRDNLIRETSHGHVWDRRACKEWLKNADNRDGGIYSMSGKLSTIEIESPTLSLLIEYHVWIGAEQEILHRFDTYIKQYTRTGALSFGIQGSTLDIKQSTTTSLNEGSYRITHNVPIVSMIEVVKGDPDDYIVGGPFKSDFTANFKNVL